MTSDIETRHDIDALMLRFYSRAMTDPVIGPLFHDLDLDHHLPVIGDFWESTLFGSGVYSRHRRNPLLIHAALDRKSPLQPHHFQRWLQLFTESIDESFTGTRATYAKQRSHAIAHRMLEFLGNERPTP
jgi:hemoglobin